MKVENIYQHNQSFPIDPQLIQLGRSVLQTNLALKPSESFLVVTDPTMEKIEAAMWFEAGKTITSNTQMIIFSGMTENAQEPPKQVTLAMSQANVTMLQTSFSLSHTKARLAACASGGRMASLPTTTLPLLQKTLAANYQLIKSRSETIANLLTQASTATLADHNGTNLTMSLTGRLGDPDTGFFTMPGEFGNLPAGEAYIAPVEGSANGLYVIDGSCAGLTLDQPITITIQDGQAVQIQGGQAALKLNQLVDRVGPLARNLAELGIGTNPLADPKGLLIEAEKAFGSVHLALGANHTFGGTVSVPFHSDGVIVSPTLKLDNQVIIKEGKWFI